MEKHLGTRFASVQFQKIPYRLLIFVYFIISGPPTAGGRGHYGDNGNVTVNIQEMVFTNAGLSSLLEIKNEFGALKSKIIPNHHYVSSFLNLGYTRRFLYFNEIGGKILSMVVTPCTSPLLWTVRFWPVSGNRLLEPRLLKSFRTERIAVFYDLDSRKGIYSVEIRSVYADSYVHLYASSGSEPVRVPSYFTESSDINPSLPKPKITVRRLRGSRLQVKWEASPLNPHLMSYCIVVNSQRDYQSICAAQGVKYGVLPPDLLHVAYYHFPVANTERYAANYYFSPDGARGKRSQQDEDVNNNNNSNNSNNSNNVITDEQNVPREASSSSLWRGDRFNNSLPDNYSPSHSQRERARDIVIGCVGKRNNYILHNLEEGKMYYFNVFIKDSSTNLTYPYVRTTVKYRTPKNLPNGIRDSKAKKMLIPAGKPTLVKFNLKKPCTELTMYVMPCGGGSIKYQLIHAYKSIIESDVVDSLDILKIAMPEKGRYYIRLMQASPSSGNSSFPIMVEIYVSKKHRRFPLPKLPYNTQIREDLMERTCDSVLIMWQSSPDPKDNEYCIFLKEESRQRNFVFKKPNQCDVDRSLTSSPFVTHSLCIQRKPGTPNEYLSQRIDSLHPGKRYVVQVLVRRHGGKSLSYDLFQLSTLSTCPDLGSKDRTS